MNLPRRELAVRRWLEMVKETQDTHRSSGTEQQCNGGEVGRRRCDGGRNGGRNGGATEGATEARRWQNLLAFHLLFGGGAKPATLASWTEAQLAMEGNEGRNRDGGRRWRRAKLCVREREDEQ